MLSAVSSLTTLLNAGSRIDNWACWLHHGLTFAALLLCSVVVSARQYVGDPIDCLFRGSGEHRTLDAYCWVQSTFTSARALDPDEVRAHPGVGPEAPGEAMRHHAYYRWVCYVLLFQAFASAAPHCIWRAYESGAVSNAASKEGLRGAGKLVLKHKGNGAFTGWVILFCETLNFAIDVGQMFFMNLFLDGEFFRHGFEVFPESALGEESREDALARLFPRVTKCSFRQFGPSGDVQTLDGLCVLPINVFNEKVYVVLWFWYWVLASVAAANLVYRAILVMSPSAREWRLRAGFLCKTEDARYFARGASFSQFMLVVALGRQIGGREEFRDMLKGVVRDMKEKLKQKSKQTRLGGGIHSLGLHSRGSYRVSCNGDEAADRADQSSSGDSEPPSTDKKQLNGKESAPGGASEPPKDRQFCNLAVELPARSSCRVSCDRTKPAEHVERSCGGDSKPPTDGLRQQEDTDSDPRKRCFGGPYDPPSEKLSTTRGLGLRADTRDKASGARLSSSEWPWPGGHVLPDDPKRQQTPEVARHQYNDGAFCSGSDLSRMGRTVRKCIEKIEKIEMSSPDQQGPAGAKDKPQKNWLEQDFHSQPEPPTTVRAERETSTFPDPLSIGDDKDKFSPV